MGNPGIEQGFPALQDDSLPAELPGKPTWSQIDGQFPQDFYSVSSWTIQHLSIQSQKEYSDPLLFS